MSTITNLRQANNKVEVMGILAEKNIQKGKNASNGKETLEGYVSIKVDDINQIRVRVSADATKKDGEPNPAYENLKGFNENAVSIAEGGIENASKVVSNSIQLNPYHSAQNGKDVLGYRTGFISVYRGENYEPKAQATVELFIKSIVPETDKEGQETGRALLKGWMPTYNGIEPLTLVAKEDIASQLQDGFSSGDTAEFYIDIINSKVEKKNDTRMMLGKPRTETTYVNELIITGCSYPYEDELAYDADAVKKAIQERDDKIKADANKAATNTQARPSGASMGRTAKW